MRWRPPAIDVALAAGLALWGALDVSGRAGVTLAGLALMAGPLAWRRVYPLASMLAVAVGFVVQALQPNPPEPLYAVVVMLIAPYSVAANSDTNRALVGLAAAFAAGAGEALLAGGDDVGFIWALTGAAWIAGRVLGSGQRRHALEREELAEAAVEAERARLARELHDVVAHAVTVMSMQAAAAEETLQRDPERARRALRQVQDSGREAVADLRRMLGVLRDDPGPQRTSPQPGLADLDALAKGFRDAGLRLRLDVVGAPRPLPTALELSAYRIVQEALTNVLRHAPGADAAVTVTYSPTGLELRVENHVSANGRGGLAGAGLGLAGIRERASLFGGTVEAGPTATGAYVLLARLPT